LNDLFLELDEIPKGNHPSRYCCTTADRAGKKELPKVIFTNYEVKNEF